MITIPDGLKVGDRVEVTITGNVGMVHKGGVNVGPLCVLASDDRWADVVVKKVAKPLPREIGSVVRAIPLQRADVETLMLGPYGWTDTFNDTHDPVGLSQVTVLFDAGAK